MNLRLGAVLLGVAVAAAATTTALADVDSGAFGGAFNVKAFTGDNKGKTLCYV